jgi:hypothetical protein
MDVLTGVREFLRRHNGLLIYLRRDDWPADIPLPTGTRWAETGAGPFDPYWRIVVEPNRTIEAVVGWFVLPLSLDDTVAWFKTEMATRGWVDGAKAGYRMTNQALLRFQHPSTGSGQAPATRVQVGIDIQWWPSKQETTAMISRVVEHPWQEPQTTEESPVAQEARAEEVAVSHPE